MYEDVDIREIPIDETHKIAILIGGFKSDNPHAYMDEVVKHYTRGKAHNEFIEKHLDIPQVRIVMSGINEIMYDTYDETKEL